MDFAPKSVISRSLGAIFIRHRGAQRPWQLLAEET
jgi:hypothetical protein